MSPGLTAALTRVVVAYAIGVNFVAEFVPVAGAVLVRPLLRIVIEISRVFHVTTVRKLV